MGATILINDGQHRRAAIEEALRERPTLGDETISVVVFADRGLKRSQQMFADLNIHAVRPTKSIKLLYDHRDALAGLSRDVVEAVPLFRDFTCFDSTSISNRSVKLFTLSSIHQSTVELIGKSNAGKIESADKDMAVEFWKAVIANMPDWQRVGTREVSSFELRRDFIHAHGVALQAIAIAAHNCEKLILPNGRGLSKHCAKSIGPELIARFGTTERLLQARSTNRRTMSL